MYKRKLAKTVKSVGLQSYYMILLINIYITQKEKHIENNTQQMQNKINNFNYINTLKRKRNEQISNNNKI